jgi:hypothetical protein
MGIGGMGVWAPMRFLRILLFVALCLMAAAEARAASTEGEGCKNAPDPDRRIELCTNLILCDGNPDSGAWPYVFRTAACAEKGQYDEAIDDHDAGPAARAIMPDISTYPTSIHFLP